MDNVDAAELLLAVLFGLICVTYGYTTIHFVMVVFSVQGLLALAKMYGVEKMASFYIALIYFVAFFVLFPYVPQKYHNILFFLAKIGMYVGALGWSIDIVIASVPEFYISTLMVSILISGFFWGCLKGTERQCLILSTSLMGSFVISNSVDGWYTQSKLYKNSWLQLGIILAFTSLGLYFQLKGTREPVEGVCSYNAGHLHNRPSLTATAISEIDLPTTPRSPRDDFVSFPFVEIHIQPEEPLPTLNTRGK